MTWQTALRKSITAPGDLGNTDGASQAAHARFPVRIPPTWADLMETTNPDDPLLKQVHPDVREEDPVPGYGTDPLDEQNHQPAPGILQKYQGRVLLLLTAACAIHCRYCFRRHFPYADSNPINSHWRQTLDWLRDANDVTEVIFSGGDPLMLDDGKLHSLLVDLETIDHLRRLRVHTRMPVVVPERVTNKLINMLANTRLKAVVVLHVNHANELGDAAVESIRKLRNAGISLLNQSVLLRGVNDNAHALITLSEALFDHGVIPYYLHLLDPVAGAAHFEVVESEALALHATMRVKLPGYLVPRLVREKSGHPGKSIIA